MVRNSQRKARVEILLNTLAAERYTRGPLLATIIDELRAEAHLEPAAEMAIALLEELRADRLAISEFAARVDALQDVVERLSSPLPRVLSHARAETAEAAAPTM